MVLRKSIAIIFLGVITIGVITFFAIPSENNVEVSAEKKIPPNLETFDENISKIELNATKINSSSKTFPEEKQCTGDARCISGFVTRVIDGDTIVVGDKSIRFALVNTPEWGDFDYTQAKYFIETICPVGSKVLVDEDDGQTEGSYGRIIAKIYCNELNLNEEILEVGHALILPEFCKVSEFSQDSWAKKHGC